MRSRGLKTLIIATALLPSLLIAIALGFYLSHSRLQDVDRLLTQRGHATALQLANAARRSLSANDNAALQQLAALALEEPGVESVTVFDSRHQPRAHSGRQLSMPLPSHFSHRSESAEMAETLRFVQPILPIEHFTATFNAATADFAPDGWVMVDYSRQPYLIETYRLLFISGCIVVLALLGACISAVFASNRLDAAVTQLRAGIQRIASGTFDTPIHLEKSNALHNLGEDLNRMTATIEHSSIELRRHLEQTNRDLRESLETVEVQNIELDLARREALEASRIKSEFLANTSHELRTPLNGIIGFTKLLLKSVLDERQREYLETIRYSAENLLGIINDILDFSKIEAGKLVLDNSAFNLRETIEETLAMLAPSANEKKLDLILLYDRQVPTELIGDALRLRQVLTNLISNAIKFTARGHIAVHVEAAGSVAARVPLKISVNDTGIGISAEQQRQLFEAFAQADASTSREFGGTGLGLAISKKLIEQMGGEIGLDSHLGDGSTFWFSLRLPVQQKPLSLRQFHLLEGKRLALCDPEPLSRRALQQLLEDWGMHIVALDSHNEFGAHTRDVDGWLLSASASTPLPPQLPAASLPLLVLQYGSAPPPAYRSAMHALQKPVNHLQLYDALCDQLCHRAVPAIAVNPPLIVRNVHVLAVDDNATNLKLVDVLLRELGASVRLAHNGRDALTLCAEEHFDLILLDIQMPELNGADVARVIRSGDSKNRETCIVALTAHVLPEEQQHLLKNGFNDCVTKPITEEQLQQLLEMCPRVNALPVQIDLCLQRARNKPILAKEFLLDLLQELPRARRAIDTQLTQHNFDELLEETHRLHGASSYSGVPQLQQCSHRLEELLKQRATNIEIETATRALLAAIDELLVWEAEHDVATLFEADTAAN